MSGNAGKAPFFELPCMQAGGICARRFACPPGNIVTEIGLCPEQQRQGMECCKPLSGGWGMWRYSDRITKRQNTIKPWIPGYPITMAHI
ncbi:hypothetical protein B5X24_HaOG209050 [Helicoverpa armigera]|uniref:Uncharacterized protein n=1 Tax=Helicoverpa armigera TaxID=29058 RepID=A0A2W1BIS4_HELAM|nr:hypothetical protein B5X24_HaOG209050 [Helicoverpa armigera]